MNKILLFSKKITVNFFYIKTGDVYRSKGCNKFKVFISGKIENYHYIDSLQYYKVELKILFYDVNENNFRDEILTVFTKDLRKIKMKIIGVYRTLY